MFSFLKNVFRALYVVSVKSPLRKIAPRSGSGFGLGLALELGLGGNFPRGQFPRTLYATFNF